MTIQKMEIVLNHMFTGDYLVENIGHEIINLYDDDKGDHYIYLCSNGKFNPREHKVPEAVILVRRPAKSRGLLEIIAVARKLTYIADPENYQRNVCYGGVSVDRLFASNSKQQSICITFRAEEFLWPKSPLYLYHGTDPKEDVPINRTNKDIHILNPFSPSRLLREYFDETTGNFDRLNAIMNKSAWETRDTRITEEDLAKSYPVNSMEVYGIQHRELSFSNAFKYFLLRFPDLLSKFIDFLGCPDISINVNINRNNITVEREKYHTDILIQDDETVIVVENKIFSDINGETPLGNQLSDYEKKVKDMIKGKKHYHFYIFVPDHNDLKIPDANRNWRRITYSKINDFLSSEDLCCKDDPQLKDFHQAIADHSQKDYNYSVMRKRFIREIKSV